jgi:hypothetical protein
MTIRYWNACQPSTWNGICRSSANGIRKIMELNVGSNIVRNTNGILMIEGKEQIRLEIGEKDHQLWLTMDLYDSQGRHAAKLRRNVWAFNMKNKFEVKTAPSSVRLTDKQSGAIVLEVNALSRDKVEILHGAFHTYLGHLLEITPTLWRIAGLMKSGGTTDSCGAAASLG